LFLSSRPKAGSVVGGLGYLGSFINASMLNRPLFTISSLRDVVVVSAAVGEYGSVYFNAKHGVWTRTLLAAIGYPQPPTQIHCDNKCAFGLANDTVKVKRGKSIDMHFHWIRDHVYFRVDLSLNGWQGKTTWQIFSTRHSPISDIGNS